MAQTDVLGLMRIQAAVSGLPKVWKAGPKKVRVPACDLEVPLGFCGLNKFQIEVCGQRKISAVLCDRRMARDEVHGLTEIRNVAIGLRNLVAAIFEQRKVRVVAFGQQKGITEVSEYLI